MKNKITIHTKKVKFRTAPEFYGLFFEDINHAADGGLYPEMIRNRAKEWMNGRKQFCQQIYQGGIQKMLKWSC